MGRFPDEMVVHRGNFKARGTQFFHDRVQLVLQQNQVAHEHRLVVRPRERSPGTKRQSRLDRQSVNGNTQMGSWKSNFIDVPRLLARPAQRLVDFGCVHPLRGHNDGRHQQQTPN
jgi:hypothetical protein